MISLYDSKETNFNNNGLVVLSDCKSFFTTEKNNSSYEVEFEYHLDDRGKWKYISEGNIVKNNDGQLFRIYRKVKTLYGVKANARHIFYDLLDNFLEDVRPTNLSGSAALDWVLTHTQYPHNFINLSDVEGYGTKYFVKKNPVDAIMGKDGIIANWGGELVRDNFTIKLLQNRGLDRGVLISYGKNIIGIEETINLDGVVTRIFATGKDGLNLTEKYVDSQYIGNYPNPKIKEVIFADIDNEAVLRVATQNYFITSKCDIPLANYKIDFLELSKTEEYKNYAVLERVYLGDIVTVKHTKLNLNLKLKVIYIKKNDLTNKIETVELGNSKLNIADAFTNINNFFNNVSNEIIQSNSDWQQAVSNVTTLLTTSLGGFVVKKQGEILIMDTEDELTTTKVWRWNLNGLGYSGTGINGPYETAITMDGRIVGSFISGLLGEFVEIRANQIVLGDSGETIPDNIISSSPNWNSAEQNAIDSAKIYADNTFVDKTTHTADYAYLEGLIDGSISTWFYDYIPSLINLPASDWTTDELKNNHLGDVFYDNTTGSAYRFALISSVYQWTPITDSAVTEALQKANDAQDTADGKRRVFVVEPTVPYDVGDLWSGGISGDLKVCKTPKLSTEVYSIDDWENASKYTDDTSLTTFVDDIYTVDKNDLLTQIDGKIESYFTSTDPNTWIEADRLKHNGDMWYNASTKLLKRYNGTTNAWELIEDQKAIDAYTNAQTAQTTADGKRTVFVSQPTTPYKVGDLWDDGTSSNLKICKVEQLTGDFDASDWSYTTVSQQISDLANDSKLTPSEKLLIKKEWEVIKLEKPKLDAQASLYTLPIDTSVNIQFTQWLNGTIKKVEPFWDYNLDGIYNTSDNFSWASATALIIYDKAYDWLNRYITNYLLLDNGLTTNLPSDFAPIITPPGQTASELNTQGEVFRKSFADYYWAKANLIGAITLSSEASAKAYAETKASEAKSAAETYALIQAELAVTEAQAYADGIITVEEQARINEAIVNLAEAKTHAETKASEAEAAAKILSDLAQTTADNAAILAENAVQPDTSYNNTYITENGIQVKDLSGGEVVTLGEFSSGLYGMKVKNDSSAEVVTMGKIAEGSYGIKASHSDGSYTQLTEDGLQRIVNGELKPYQYLTYIVQETTHGLAYEGNDYPVGTGGIWSYGKWIQLPLDFQNKDFKASISISDFPTVSSGIYTTTSSDIRIVEYDYINAKVRVVAWFFQSGYDQVGEYDFYDWAYYTGFNIALMVIV